MALSFGKELHHSFGGMFVHREIEPRGPKSTYDDCQIHLVIDITYLEGLFCKPCYILPESFFFRLLDIEDKSDWFPGSPSSNEMGKEVFVELQEGSNRPRREPIELETSFSLQCGRESFAYNDIGDFVQ